MEIICNKENAWNLWFCNSGVDDAFGRNDFARDMAALGSSFDADLFSLDEALKVGLNPLMLDELQMLTDPSVVTDSATEDSFRLD